MKPQRPSPSPFLHRVRMDDNGGFSTALDRSLVSLSTASVSRLLAPIHLGAGLSSHWDLSSSTRRLSLSRQQPSRQQQSRHPIEASSPPSEQNVAKSDAAKQDVANRLLELLTQLPDPAAAATASPRSDWYVRERNALQFTAKTADMKDVTLSVSHSRKSLTIKQPNSSAECPAEAEVPLAIAATSPVLQPLLVWACCLCVEAILLTAISAPALPTFPVGDSSTRNLHLTLYAAADNSIKPPEERSGRPLHCTKIFRRQSTGQSTDHPPCLILTCETDDDNNVTNNFQRPRRQTLEIRLASSDWRHCQLIAT